MLVDLIMALLLIASFALVIGFTHWCANVIRH